MIFERKQIDDVCEIFMQPHEDQRGFFSRTYDRQIFEDEGLDRPWVQENHSYSAQKGTIRGIHFQYPPDSETKLLRVILGEIFFVVVDLRLNSPTFGQWTSTVVSLEKRNMLYIPRGCAPGMCTLTDHCHLVYKVDNYYNPSNEDVIVWNDPDLNIRWPVSRPNIISERDRMGRRFADFVQARGGIVSTSHREVRSKDAWERSVPEVCQ